LNMNQGQIQLDLRYGDLVTALQEKSQIEVTAGTQKFDLKPQNSETSKVQIQKSRAKRVKVKLLEGKAQLTDKENKKQVELVKEKSVVVATKAVEKKNLPQTQPTLHLLTADKTPITLFQKGEPFSVQWESSEIYSFRLELSTSSDFAKKVYVSTTNLKSHLVKENLDQGWYFVRVQGLNEEGADLLRSQTHRLFISYYERPKITLPEMNSSLNFEIETVPDAFKAPVDLSWQSAPQYKSFEWQISDSNDFNKILASGISQRTAIQSPPLPGGSYSARVRGQLEDNKTGPWSEIQNWKITATEKKFFPVELITKKINFNPVAAERNPAALQSPSLSWKSFPNAKSYVIEISKDKNLKNKLSFETTETAWTWDKYELGNHFFRVIAKTKNQKPSLPSEIGFINVNLPNPEIEPIPEIYEKSDKMGEPAPAKVVSLKWTKIPFASKYVLEIDSNPAFKKPITREISSNSSSFELEKPGKYHARVQAFNQNEPLTSFSNPQNIVYDYRTHLAVPTPIEPNNNVSIFLQKDIELYLWLSWKNDPLTDHYELQIATDKNFTKILIHKELKETRFLIKDKIPLGRIFWRIKSIAKNPEDSSDWSPPQIFNLIFKTNENYFQ